MNYRKIYDQLIERACSRLKPDLAELHHILPKCLGGSNDKSNLVYLTPAEHYIAHQLLVKLYPKNGKLSYALFAMTSGYRRLVGNKLYGWVREQFLRHNRGETHPRYGKPMSEEEKQRRSLKYRGSGNPRYGKTGIASPMFGKKGKDSPVFGFKKSADEIARQSARMRGDGNVSKRPEVRAKQRDAALRRGEEDRRKRSKAARFRKEAAVALGVAYHKITSEQINYYRQKKAKGNPYAA